MSRQDSKQIESVKVMLLKGDNGSSIESIEKTGTSGAVDTYTITLTDGSKFTFNVTNGATITNIAKTSTSGLVDTYTITMSDETTSTFTVTNGADGVGISNIAKTGTVGAIDTYTITLTDGSTYTFTVTNATGTVDASLDTNSTNAIQNKAVAEKFNAIDDDMAPTENGTTASRAYAIGDFILRNNQFYKVITAIAIGGTFSVGVNIEEKSIGEVLSELVTNKLDKSNPSFTGALNQSNLTTTLKHILSINNGTQLFVGNISLGELDLYDANVVDGKKLSNIFDYQYIDGTSINIDNYTRNTIAWLNCYGSTLGTLPNNISSGHAIFINLGGVKQILIPVDSSNEGVWVRQRDNTSSSWTSWVDRTSKGRVTLWTGDISDGGTLVISGFDATKYSELIFEIYDPTGGNIYSIVSMPLTSIYDDIKNSNFIGTAWVNVSGGGFTPARFEISIPANLSTGASIYLGHSYLRLKKVVGVKI